MRVLGIALHLLLAIPAVAAAQLRDLSLGGGIGVTASDQASGRGYHGAASMQVMQLPRNAHLRAELMYQTGTLYASPFACERVTQIYCLGRTDNNQIAAAAIFVRIVSLPVGSFRFTVDPIGAGLYHRRTRSAEHQGPTTTCFRDGQLIGCPNNPDWATFRYSRTRTTLGANSGAGVELDVARVRLFLEARAHLPFESGESIAGAVPLTFGIKF